MCEKGGKDQARGKGGPSLSVKRGAVKHSDGISGEGRENVALSVDVALHARL